MSVVTLKSVYSAFFVACVKFDRYADIRTTLENQNRWVIGIGLWFITIWYERYTFCGSENLTLIEVETAINRISEAAGFTLDVIFVIQINKDLDDEIIIVANYINS